jgi:hypothetical protein
VQEVEKMSIDEELEQEAEEMSKAKGKGKGGKAKLSSILDDLSDDRVNDAVRSHYAANASYSSDKRKIMPQSDLDFQDEMNDYLTHHYKEAVGEDLTKRRAGMRFDELMEWAQTRGIRGVSEAALRSTAKNKGMNQAINDLLTVIEAKERQGYSTSVIKRIDKLDWDHQVDLMGQYKKIWKGVLSKENGGKTAEELAKDYQAVITEHVEQVEPIKDRQAKYKGGGPKLLDKPKEHKPKAEHKDDQYRMAA